MERPRDQLLDVVIVNKFSKIEDVVAHRVAAGRAVREFCRHEVLPPTSATGCHLCR